MKRLWKKDRPIINSLTETDTYKITMLYFIFSFFPDLVVKFAFKNRTNKIKLGKLISVGALNEHIRHVQSLRFSEIQLDYFRSWRLFPEKFIQELKEIRLPDPKIKKTKDGQLSIEVEGSWFHTTLWELYILPIVSELSSRAQIGEGNAAHIRYIKEGERRMLEAIEQFKLLRWKFALFTPRRRASGDWERHITKMLLDIIPDKISGTSNVQLAMEFLIEAIGTNAHELAMALYALRRHESKYRVWRSQYEVLEKWMWLYGHQLLIMLPDTFGSRQFYDGLDRTFLEMYRGARQDSGSPFDFGEMMIEEYVKNRIDPLQKVVLFTDGLNPQKMLDIENHFFGRIGGGFGIGTFLANNIGIQALSIVMKLVQAAGNDAIKLSDNLAKSIGAPQEQVTGKDIFGYTNTFTENCEY